MLKNHMNVGFTVWSTQHGYGIHKSICCDINNGKYKFYYTFLVDLVCFSPLYFSFLSWQSADAAWDENSSQDAAADGLFRGGLCLV